MIRQFIRDTGIYGISGMLVRLISFLLLPLYVRVLSTADYGIIDLLTLFGTLSGVLLSLELYQSVARYFGPADELSRKEYASTGLMFYIYSFTIFSTLMLVFAEPLSALIFGVSGHVEVFRLAILSMQITAIFNYLQNMLRYALKPMRFAVLNIFYAVATLSSSVLYVVVFETGLQGVYLGVITGGIPAVVLALWYNKPYLTISWNAPVLKRMLRFSLPLVVSALAVYLLTYIDRLLIRYFISLSELGVYAVAFRIAAIPVVIQSIINASLLPLIYNKYRDSGISHDLRKIYIFSFAGGLMLIAVLSCLSDPLIGLITTPEYQGAAKVLPLLLFAGFLLQFAGMFAGLSIAEKTRIMALIYFAGLLLNIILNLFLIPLYGINGAGWSALVSSIFIFTSQACLSEKYFPVWKKNRL